jgi:predicted phosphodiesterase
VNQERFEVSAVAPRMTLAGVQHREQPVTAVIITGHTHKTRICRQNSDPFSAKLRGVVCIVTAVT